MEQPISSRKLRQEKVPGAVYENIIRAYCGEFDNWKFYKGLPRYDKALREMLARMDSRDFIRISFTEQPVVVFVPINYRSVLGGHGITFPVLQRSEHGECTVLEATAFIKLAEREAFKKRPGLIGKHPRQVINHFTLQQEQPLFERYCLEGKIKLPSAEAIYNKVTGEENQLEEQAKAAIREYLNQVCRQNAGRQPLRGKEPSKAIGPSWLEAVLFEQVLPLVGELGRRYRIPEKGLLRSIHAHLGELQEANKGNDVFENVLSQRFLTRRLLFLSAFGREVGKVPNPLHEVYSLDKVFLPTSPRPVFERHFPAENVRVKIRPVDLDHDLEMLHEWFHREHAKPIWQMDWPIDQLDAFYREMLPDPHIHSFIGEINGEATFNVEVYWPTRDVLGDYYAVAPDDYGTHLFIAPVEKEKKKPSLVTQAILDWLFYHPEIKRLVGEGSVASLSALMNKVHVGFKLQGIIEMPHKKAHLNTCYREWYWQKFPENQHIQKHITVNYED